MTKQEPIGSYLIERWSPVARRCTSAGRRARRVLQQEVAIRNVAVGLIAVATLAAASLIIRNRKGVENLTKVSPRTDVDDLYAAGL